MSSPRSGPDHGSEQRAVVVLAAAIVGALAAGGAWLTGQPTLLATGDGWTPAPPTRSPTLLTALLHGEGPPRAWRTAYPTAPALPSPAGYWAVAVVLALAAATLFIWAVLRWGPSLRGRRVVAPARWATRLHERPIVLPEKPEARRWRLVAGRSRATGRLLGGGDCVSAVVFGPNGSGKTTSLIVPNVLDWDGPVVLTTAKPQDLEPICTARAQHGPVWVVAPGGAPGHPCVGWSPIDAAGTAEAADRVAEWLVDASGMTTDPKARPWNAQARKYLKGLLLAAHLSGGGIEEWTTWIHAAERARDTIEDILTTAGETDTARDYASTWQIHEEGKGSVLFTALGLADSYTRPGIRHAITTSSGFPLEELFEQNGTLCLVTPNAEGDRFAPYFTTLLTAVIHTAETQAAASGGPLSPRLLLALDEAGNAFRYPRLPHLLTTSRGNGIQLLLVYHDLAQVEHLYGGRQVARTVLSNAKMRMLLPGVGDLDTLRYWSELMGRTRTPTHGENRSHRREPQPLPHRTHRPPRPPPPAPAALPDGQAILLYQNPHLPGSAPPLVCDPTLPRLQVTDDRSGTAVDNAGPRRCHGDASSPCPPTEPVGPTRRARSGLRRRSARRKPSRPTPRPRPARHPRSPTPSPTSCTRMETPRGPNGTPPARTSPGAGRMVLARPRTPRSRDPLGRPLSAGSAGSAAGIPSPGASPLLDTTTPKSSERSRPPCGSPGTPPTPSPTRPLTGATDWHDRWLPGVLHRLEHGAFALDCSHHPPPTPTQRLRRPR